MNLILTVVVTLLIFGVLIAIHEFGHYLVARAFKVGIREYSIGMGPKIWQKKGKYNKFTLRALPIGGYVDMVGESAGDDGSDPEDAGKPPLNTKPVWQRMLIVLAGPAMNILLGLLVMSVIVICRGEFYGTTIERFATGAVSNRNMVYVTEDYGSFEKGDIIYAVDGRLVSAENGLDAFLSENADAAEVVVIRRNSNSLLNEVKDALLAELPLFYDVEEGAFYLTRDYGEFKKDDTIISIDGNAVSASDYSLGSPEERVERFKAKYTAACDVQVKRIYKAFIEPTEETVDIPSFNGISLKSEDGYIKIAESTDTLTRNGIIVSVDGVAVEENETPKGFMEKFGNGGVTVIRYRWYLPVQNPIVIDASELSDAPLAVSGALCVGDTVKKVGGYSANVYADMTYGVFNNGVEPTDVVVERDGKELTVKNVVFFKGSQQGVLYGASDFVPKKEEKTFGNIVYNAVFEPISSLRMTVDSVVQTFKGKYGIEALSGPVGIGEQVGDALSQDEGGMEYLFNLIVLISLSLGVCNLLPLPVLDGGRFVLYAIEAVRRKPLSAKLEQVLMAISWVLVIGLMIFVMFKDIIGLF